MLFQRWTLMLKSRIVVTAFSSFHFIIIVLVLFLSHSLVSSSASLFFFFFKNTRQLQLLHSAFPSIPFCQSNTLSSFSSPSNSLAFFPLFLRFHLLTFEHFGSLWFFNGELTILLNTVDNCWCKILLINISRILMKLFSSAFWVRFFFAVFSFLLFVSLSWSEKLK